MRAVIGQTIRTQKTGVKGIVREVVFAGVSPNDENVLNFKVRYLPIVRPNYDDREYWTTYQIQIKEA